MIFKCRDFVFDCRARPLAFGILNVSPDSFSDGAPGETAEAAVARAKALFAAGADIVDVGGVSTRPGAEAVSPSEEQSRVLPVVRALAAERLPVSVDTFCAATASAALAAGAVAINCPAMPRAGDAVASAAASAGAGFVATWAESLPAAKPEGPGRPDTVVARALSAFDEMAKVLAECGIGKDYVLFDPGIGFGKSAEEDVALLSRARALCAARPVMIGVSRKSVLGKICGEPDPRRRLGASVCAAAFAALSGAAALRVHDVFETRQAVEVALALGKGAAQCRLPV